MRATMVSAMLLAAVVAGCNAPPEHLEPMTPYAADLPVPTSFVECVGSKVNRTTGRFRFVDMTWKGRADHRRTVDFMLEQMAQAGWTEQHVWRSPSESRIRYNRSGQPAELCTIIVRTVEQPWPDPAWTYITYQVAPVVQDNK